MELSLEREEEWRLEVSLAEVEQRDEFWLEGCLYNLNS